MEKLLMYVCLFAAGVVLDEFMGARVKAAIVAEVAKLHTNLLAEIKAEITKLTSKL